MRRFPAFAALIALSGLGFMTTPASGAPAFRIQQPAAVSTDVIQAGHYYGHPVRCWWKKVRTYDYYGNLVIKRVKVCR
ncbi:hypothetical protein LXM94_22970 [Rhizobium sp. TRM95111]|uniref:hypothetical protein n=1 Tax=Rhizobium alarense TaxID=2846851 RepID=UPI001F166E8B|nr:hypothetical protein [Rhizobium alarense]MCF3642834.1 hypothetical protein [Rhizobium alarense]